jgi:hypothetical protein
MLFWNPESVGENSVAGTQNFEFYELILDFNLSEPM